MSHWPQWYDDACPFAVESFNMNDASPKTFDWMCAMSDWPQSLDDACPFTVESFNINDGSSKTFDWMCAMSDWPQSLDHACPFTVESFNINDGSSKTFDWMCAMSVHNGMMTPLVLLQWRIWRWTTGVRRNPTTWAKVWWVCWERRTRKRSQRRRRRRRRRRSKAVDKAEGDNSTAIPDLETTLSRWRKEKIRARHKSRSLLF